MKTTERGQAGAQAASAYQATDLATRPTEKADPLWLPAGWLAVVMVLSAMFPAWASAGWRSRSTSKPVAHQSESRIRTVDYRSDLAGPALRVAQNPTSDPLLNAIERPFGVDNNNNGGAIESIPAPNEAEGLFNDLPPDPFEEPMDNATHGHDQHSHDATHGDSTHESSNQYVPPTVADEDDHLYQERIEAAADCAEELAQLKAQRLDTIDLEIGIHGVEGEDYPFVCSIDDGSLYAPRQWAEVTFMWKASALCHKPLYFEDVHLERYGHSWGPIAQPIVSGAHFFTRFPVLPYCMGLKAPNECVYTLGHYRPGNCAPYMIDPVPFTWRAALYQTGGVFGVIGFLP